MPIDDWFGGSGGSGGFLGSGATTIADFTRLLNNTDTGYGDYGPASSGGTGGLSMFDGLGDWLGSNGSWLAPAVGAGLGAYGASQGQTTTNSMPPEFQPLAGAVAQRGLDIGNMAYTPYDQNRTAGFNPYQFAGMDMVANRAQQQGGLPAQAESALNRTISGGYLGAGNPYGQGNPYLEQGIQNTMGDMAQTYNQQVAPTMAATAYKSGSFGNTGQQEMETASRDQLQRNMGRVSGDMRMQDYGMQQSMFNAERNRMMQGLGQASNIYGMGYIPGQQMMGIGATMQQQGQNVLNDQYSQFQEAQNWPFRTYDAMRAPFGGVNPGGSTTQPGGSTAAGLLGGAMLGSQLWGGYGGSGSTNYNVPLPGDNRFVGPLIGG